MNCFLCYPEPIIIEKRMMPHTDRGSKIDKFEKLQHYDSEKIEFKQVYTVPNLLTVLRILLLPVLIWSLFELSSGGSRALPIIIGAIMLGTDLIDGHFARILNQSTKLGSLLDPVSDKLIVIGLGVTLFILGYLPLSFLAFILIRDLLITVFGLLVYYKMGDLMQTNIVARMTPLFWGITYILYVADLSQLGLALGIISVTMTIISGILYLIGFINLMKKERIH